MPETQTRFGVGENEKSQILGHQATRSAKTISDGIQNCNNASSRQSKRIVKVILSCSKRFRVFNWNSVVAAEWLRQQSLREQSTTPNKLEYIETTHEKHLNNLLLLGLEFPPDSELTLDLLRNAHLASDQAQGRQLPVMKGSRDDLASSREKRAQYKIQNGCHDTVRRQCKVTVYQRANVWPCDQCRCNLD